MNAIGWPTIFNGNSTIVVKDNEATENCIKLLLSSSIGELFGDPGFGVRLKHYTHHQNNYILKDIIIDEIYTQLTTFCPQLILNRKNISISIDRYKMYVTIVAKTRNDFITNTYNLVLYETKEKE